MCQRRGFLYSDKRLLEVMTVDCVRVHAIFESKSKAQEAADQLKTDNRDKGEPAPTVYGAPGKAPDEGVDIIEIQDGEVLLTAIFRHVQGAAKSALKGFNSILNNESPVKPSAKGYEISKHSCHFDTGEFSKCGGWETVDSEGEFGVSP